MNGTPLRKALSILFLYFVLPIQQLLTLYTARYWPELVRVFTEQGFSLVSRSLILESLGREIGLVALLALVGLVLLVNLISKGGNRDLTPLIWDGVPRLVSRFSRYQVPVLLTLLILAWMAAPLQHLITANGRSLWKNCAYSLIFLSPLAGYCVATIVKLLRPRGLMANLPGVFLLCAGFYYFADQSMDSNWSFQRSWPNTESEITYLRESGLDQNSRVLAEGMDIYEYYFDFGVTDREVWNSFWYMEYGGLSGQEGALAAIRDHALDFVIVDNYYYPGIRERVDPILAEAGYIVGWQEEQILRSGETVLLQVFVRGDGESP